MYPTCTKLSDACDSSINCHPGLGFDKHAHGRPDNWRSLPLRHSAPGPPLYVEALSVRR